MNFEFLPLIIRPSKSYYVRIRVIHAMFIRMPPVLDASKQFSYNMNIIAFDIISTLLHVYTLAIMVT